MDILCGTDRLRQAVDEGWDLNAEEQSWTAPLGRFARVRRPHLLYR